jgi:hypothetical protein
VIDGRLVPRSEWGSYQNNARKAARRKARDPATSSHVRDNLNTGQYGGEVLFTMSDYEDEDGNIVEGGYRRN